MDFDPDRFIADKGGQFGFYLLRRWGSVDLVFVMFRKSEGPSPAADLSSALAKVELNLAELRDDPFLVQFELEENDALLWPLWQMLKAWSVSLNATCARSMALKGGRPDRRHGIHLDRLGSWVQETRDIAAETRAVFGSVLHDAMLDVAQQAEDALSWPDRWLKAEGPADPQRRVDLLLNIELWALDQILVAIDDELDMGSNRLTRPYWTRQIFEPATAVLQANKLPVVGAEAWKQRIWRVEQQILPGAREALIAEVLIKLRDEEITRTIEIPPSA